MESFPLRLLPNKPVYMHCQMLLRKGGGGGCDQYTKKIVVKGRGICVTGKYGALPILCASLRR